MKKLLLLSCVCLLFGLESCHNYEREKSVHQAESTSDSMLKADSLKTGTNSRNDRVIYVKALQLKIDSLHAKLIIMDSSCNSKSTAKAKKWHENRNRIITSINRLKDKAAIAGTVTENKWNAFKQQVDTVMLNIKDDWNYGE